MNIPGGAGYTPQLAAVSAPQTSGSASAAFAAVIDAPQSNLATASALSTGTANYAQANQTLPTQPTQGFLHITQAQYTVTGGADLLALLQPLNFTSLAANGTATTTTSASITLTGDPGKYSTNYRNLANGTAGTGTLGNPPVFPNAVTTADNLIAAADWVAYQAQDGTWRTDVVAAVTGSSTVTVGLTNGMPNLKAGSLVYFFGVAADKDPATGKLRPQLTPAATSAQAQWRDPQGCIASTYFNGDPLIALCKNTDNTMVLNSLTGFASYR